MIIARQPWRAIPLTVHFSGFNDWRLLTTELDEVVATTP